MATTYTHPTAVRDQLITQLPAVSSARSFLSSVSPNSGVPLPAALSHITTNGRLPAGSTVTVSGHPGQTSVVLELLASATQSGSWAALVGLPTVGVAAATERGVDLHRVAFVLPPATAWLSVVSTLLPAVDLVIAEPPQRIPRPAATKLLALAKRHASVLLLAPTSANQHFWPLPSDITLTCSVTEWSGVTDGHGSISSYFVTVDALHRRSGHQQRAGLSVCRSTLNEPAHRSGGKPA